MADLERFQETYEQRFGCCICLGPKLNMVSGQCQHRICDDCLYINQQRRPCMKSCPLCGMVNSFPETRPCIPLQVIEVQRCIGVEECPNKCSTQLWYWEREEHLKCCPKVVPKKSSPKTPSSRASRRRVSDLGTVSITSRVTRGSAKQGEVRRGTLRRRLDS